MRLLPPTLLAAAALITGCTTPATHDLSPRPPAHAGLLSSDEPVLGGSYNLRVYVVNRGDTLAKIGRKAGVSIKELRQLNPELDPTRLRIGQQIRISEQRFE